MIAMAIVMLGGTGCSTAPTTRSVSDVGPAEPVVPQAPVTEATGAAPADGAAPAVRQRNPAVASLAAAARQHRAEGDPERAAASLERALRIDPDDAELWLALAEIRLEQGLSAQAAGLARRAETLAPPGSETASRARALAARATGP
jgi:cytochrome c-type biogenesis protein CcmH/NrfG